MNRVCPKCHGANVRRSSTPVDEVTWRNQFYSRYRCRECMLQFWVISRKTYMTGAALLGAIVLAIIGVVVIEVVFNPEPAPSRRGSLDASARVADARHSSVCSTLQMRARGTASWRTYIA